MTVVKFPFAASRHAYARKPRKSKNGTPEERAAAKNDLLLLKAVKSLPLAQKKILFRMIAQLPEFTDAEQSA